MSSKQPQRANKMRTVWVALCAIWATFLVCIRTIYASYGRQYVRERSDKMIRIWSNSLMRMCRIHLTFHGLDKLQLEPGKRYMIMSNHSSLLDIPVGFLLLKDRSVRMVAKSELSKVWLFGRACRAAEICFIDRDNREQAIKDLAFARQKMESGIVIWIAPEGTRSEDGQLLPFKKGAFRLAIDTGAIIIPVAIKNMEKVLPKKSWKLSLHQNVEVHYGDMIDTADYSVTKRHALAKEVRQNMLKLLGQDETV